MIEIQPDPEQAIPGSYAELPCGCKLWNQWLHPAAVCAGPHDGEHCGAFVYDPCSLDCEYYLYSVRESKALGHRLEHRIKPFL